MSQKFKTILTNAGVQKLAAGLPPDGKKVIFTAMAVGDGGGSLPVPKPEQTALVREVWRALINTITPHPKYANCVVVELIIPPEVGGFWTRELGLYDSEGVLIAVANMAESYKPLLAEGSGRAQTVRMVIAVSNIASVELQVDSSTVMATKEYVDDEIDKHAKSRNHPDGTLKDKGFVQLSNATDSDSETLAATPKAVKAACALAKQADENAGKRLQADKNLSDVKDAIEARENLGLGDIATHNANEFLPIAGGNLLGDLKVGTAEKDGTIDVNFYKADGTYLPGTIQRSLPNCSDANIAPFGFSGVFGAKANFPVSPAYGTLLTMSSPGTRGFAVLQKPTDNVWNQQIFFSTDAGSYVRTQTNTGGWTPWRVLATTEYVEARINNVQAWAGKWVTENFVMNIDLTAATEIQFWDGRGYPKGTDGGAMYNFSMVGGANNVGSFHYRYLRKLINGQWIVIN
jgi:hypothetical protein